MVTGVHRWQTATVSSRLWPEYLRLLTSLDLAVGPAVLNCDMRAIRTNFCSGSAYERTAATSRQVLETVSRSQRVDPPETV
jgi:hypothetical protein